MANIGSEVERTISWKKRGNEEFSKKAFHRALELIDITLAGNMSASQYKEIARVREVLVDWYLGTNSYGSTDTLWQKYFMAFTVAVRFKA